MGIICQEYLKLMMLFIHFSIDVQCDMRINKSQILKQKGLKYHPFHIPPSIVLSKLHRQCSQFGQIQTSQSQSQQQFSSCPCCNQPPRKQLPICCKDSEIYEVSEPVGYYFSFLKIMGGTLFLMMLASGVYTLVQILNNCISGNGEQSQCYYVYGIPIPRIHVFFSTPLIIMNCVVIIFLYLTAGYLFFKQAYNHQRILCHNQKPSDYSILLSGIDHKQITKIHLQQFFEDFDVTDIVYTHKIHKYMKKLSQKSVLEAKRDLYSEIQEKQQFQKHEAMIRKIDDKLLHIKNQLTLGHDQQLRTDKIIVTFETMASKERFDQLYRMKLTQNIYHTFCGGSPLMISQKPIYIEPLGEPYEIVWQNLQVKSKNRYLRILISNISSIVILLGSFVLIGFLSKNEEDRDTVGDILMSVLFAVLIEVVNTIFVVVISNLTKWERRYTKTGEITIMLYKKCAGFFLNTTFLPFCLFLFQVFVPDEDDLIRNIFTIFFISNLISPIVGFYIHPRFLYMIYERKKIQKQVENHNCLYTQIKTNSIFEKQTFMLDERYALASQLITNCMFYAAIFPVGILITLVGIIITYWSSKFWLLRYCSLPKLSYRIGRNVNYISCLFPCVYAFGYAANLYMVKYQVNFNRQYSIYIALCTIPLTLFFIFYGQKIAIRYIQKNRSSVTQCLSKKSALFSYKNFNPTTFLHSNIANEKFEKMLIKDAKQEGGQNKRTIWDNLNSYVMAKQMGIDIRDDEDFDEKLSRSSGRMRKNQGEEPTI